MASIKISELNEATEMNDSDLLAVVDVSADETKKITFENLFKNNIEILTGTQALELSQDGDYKQTAFTLNYPSGFNQNNTVVLAFIGEYISGRVGAYGEPPENSKSVSLLSSNIPRHVSLWENDIHVYLYSPVTSGTPTYTYKIILMKLS